MFCSRMTCSTYQIIKDSSFNNINNHNSSTKESRQTGIQFFEQLEICTRIRAIASWPACKNWAISLRICLSCMSLLFCSNLIREMDKFKHVLLQKYHQYQKPTPTQQQQEQCKIKQIWLQDSQFDNHIQLKQPITNDNEYLKPPKTHSQQHNWSNKNAKTDHTNKSQHTEMY